MKKIFSVTLLVIILFSCGCSEQKANLNLNEAVNGTSKTETAERTTKKTDDDYLDLSKMSGTVIYSQISNIVYTPEKYVGKTIKIKGQFNAYKDEKTKKQYYAVVIPDATACCQQGLEFEWKGEHKYPDDYPKDKAEITVEGRFETYKEGQFTYMHLTDAELSF